MKKWGIYDWANYENIFSVGCIVQNVVKTKFLLATSVQDLFLYKNLQQCIRK